MPVRPADDVPLPSVIGGGCGSDGLFHVSESGTIWRFEPRRGVDGRDLVWAIGASHLVNYLLPRDCPRVTFHALPSTTEADRRLLGGADHVVAIEASWLVRCQRTPLWCYRMPPASFSLDDDVAAYYVSGEAVDPLGVERIARPLDLLRARGATLVLHACLWALRERVAASTLGYSIIRFGNAAPAPREFESQFSPS